MADDDFDLFPKREHLDPFSFDSKEEEKDAQSAEEGQDEDVIFNDSQPLPDTTDAQPPGEIPAQEVPTEPLEDMPKPSIDDSEFDLPADFFAEEEQSVQEPFEEISESMPGPIPDKEPEQVLSEPELDLSTRSKPIRRGPSPFIMVGGALLVILILLWGALTYLKRENRPVQTQLPAQATIELRRPAVEPPPVEPPASEPSKAEQPVPEQPSDGSEPDSQVITTGGMQREPEAPSGKGTAGQKPAGKKADLASVQIPKSEPSLSPSVRAAGSGYSVQVGALILKSSIKDLEKKLSAIGYNPFFKEGTTRATMNFLTVGPLRKGEEQRALKRIRNAGIEADMQQTAKGMIINAGGFLLSGNATRVSERIRALGFPVKLERKETQLPITLVRVGRYGTKLEAAQARDDLKKKGLDAIVVKLQ
ncbi:MAG: SPOR domain-containing protein [bacterium]